jgi:hypothetical protein
MYLAFYLSVFIGDELHCLLCIAPASERNWSLKPVTARSRDNFPNPTTASASGPYVPTNSPAISDLFDLFQF